MPRVPIIDAPSVRAAPLPSFRQNLRFEPGQAGQAIKATGQMVGQVWNAVAEEKQKADAARAVEELGAFTREADAELFDPTVDEASKQPKGYTLKRGKVAFADRDNTQGRIEALVEQHTANLVNDDQKVAFLAQAREKVNTYSRQIQVHAGREAENAQSQAYKINREAGLQHVASFADDPAGRTEGIESVTAAADAEAITLGLDPESREKWVRIAETDARVSALNSLLARGNIREAESFYAASKDKLGDKGDRIARQIEELRVANVVDQKASAIVAASLIPGTSWAAPGKAQAAVEQLRDVRPEEKERIRQAVEHQVAKLEQTRKTTAERYKSYGITVYEETGTLESRAMAPIRSWLLDPVNGASEYWAQIKRYDRDLKSAGRTSSAEDRRAQNEANTWSMEHYQSLGAGEQVRTDIKAVYGGIADPTTLLRLKQVQNASKKVVDGGGLASETEFQRFATKAAKDAKLPKDVAADFVMSIADWRVKYLEDHDGQEPTRAEMKAAVADQLLFGERAEGEGVKGWFQPNRYKFQAAEKGEKFIPFPAEEQPYMGAKAEQYRQTAANRDEIGTAGIPIPSAPSSSAPVGPTAAQAAEIRATFEARGKKPTEEQILRVWRAREGIE